jgi:hypothetical protein
MESQLDDEEVKMARTFDPIVRSRLSFWFSGSHFPWGCYGIETRWWGGLVVQTWVMSQNGRDFDSIVGSPINFCTSFRWPFSIGFLCSRYSDQNGRGGMVSHTWVTDQNAITLDHTIGSRLNICMSFLQQFSLGLIWNPNLATRRSGRPDLSKGLK